MFIGMNTHCMGVHYLYMTLQYYSLCRSLSCWVSSLPLNWADFLLWVNNLHQLRRGRSAGENRARVCRTAGRQPNQVFADRANLF
jgi:hypothetical protein